MKPERAPGCAGFQDQCMELLCHGYASGFRLGESAGVTDPGLTARASRGYKVSDCIFNIDREQHMIDRVLSVPEAGSPLIVVTVGFFTLSGVVHITLHADRHLRL